MTEARYLYAISRRLDEASLTGVAGVAGGPVEGVEHHGLVAVVSNVPLDEYGEEGLRRNLEQLDWLERVARGHDDVVQAVAASGPVAPLRLATICLDDDGVRARLDEWHTALTEVLDRVEGRREWSVKAYAPAGAASPDPQPSSPGPSGGAEYLRRKKAQARERSVGQESALRLAEQVHETLSGRSVASRRLPAQDPRLTGREALMLLNGAYLVEADDGADFEAEARRLADAHPELGLEWRGPWPPYSFAMLEQG